MDHGLTLDRACRIIQCCSMATTTTGRSFTSMQSRPRKAPKAKCAENQGHVDFLFDKREKVGKNNFAFTLKRATESIAKHQEPILSYDQALALPYVGPTIANMICPQYTQESISLSQSSVEASPSSSSVSSRNRTSRKKRSNAVKVLEPIMEKSSKELAYLQAVEDSSGWKNLSQQLTWRVILLIDQRERQSEHITAKCKMSGIPCEVKQLPIGDMAWIAQGTDSNGNVQAQLLLGTIIERKTIEDLKASLFGTRYNEQQLRLQSSGMPQVIFLIEGDLNADLFRCPADTLHSTVWTIRLHKGFSILQTTHMDDTVKTLKRMHRRILQRTFPSAFYSESLPTFAEVDATGRRRSSVGGSSSRKRRRQRIQSLMEMSFEVDPVPMQGYERFITFAELKAKIEYDRERGTRTVANVHAAMMKQVATVSERKCQAICRTYQVPSQLLKTYDEQDDEVAKKQLLSYIELDETGSETTHKLSRVGPRSSAELFVAYCTPNETTSTAVGTNRESAYVHLSTNVLNQQQEAVDSRRPQGLGSTSLSSLEPVQPAAASMPTMTSESSDDTFWSSLYEEMEKQPKASMRPNTRDDLLGLGLSSDEEPLKPAAINRAGATSSPAASTLNKKSRAPIERTAGRSPICLLDSPDPVPTKLAKRAAILDKSPEIIVLD